MTLRKNASLHSRIAKLGDELPLPSDISNTCEAFIFSLYTSTKMPESTADQLRYWMFCQKSRKVNLCHQKRIPFTTTLKGVITKHWYGSGRWRQCKPYQHLLVTDGSYKVKTWKSSTCQGNLLRRDCWSLPFVSARNLDANESVLCPLQSK